MPSLIEQIHAEAQKSPQAIPPRNFWGMMLAFFRAYPAADGDTDVFERLISQLVAYSADGSTTTLEERMMDILPPHTAYARTWDRVNTFLLAGKNDGMSYVKLLKMLLHNAEASTFPHLKRQLDI